MNVIVKKSKIHGRGVFAAKNFKKGEVVLKWKIKKLKKSDIENINKKDKIYIYKISKNQYILEQKPERYVNHSCSPNTKVKNFSDIAIKEIRKGEEITSNYSKASLTVNFNCDCGAKKCRKIIK